MRRERIGHAVRVNRRMLLLGVPLVAALAFAAWLSPTGWLPAIAVTTPIGRREYSAAFLGLLLVAFIAVGFDWQDWF